MDILKNKLIKIERYLNIYNQENTLLQEIKIPISDKLEIFITTIGSKFELYDGYALNDKELKYINSLFQKPIDINMKNLSYYIVTLGVYDWDK